MRTRSTWPLLACLALTPACSTDGGSDAAPADLEEELVVVEDGKADNYYSDVAAEYEVSGRLVVPMSEADFADEARRGALVTNRLTAFGLYLTTYLTDKFRGIDSNNDGEISESEVFFRNDGYGGFHAMVRNFSVEALDVAADGQGAYVVSFTIDVAGPRNLLSLLPRAENTVGDLTFELKMPKHATVDPESVPRGEIRNFDPGKYQGELETVLCAIRPHVEVANAFPAFDAFMADGVFDITMFYGYDYNEARYDLIEAREGFDQLVGLGFTAPVSSFEALKADSGPFKLQAKADGREVTFEVRLFHADMFQTDRKGQHDLAVSELVTRDVFFYNGHAGPYFGFYLDAAYAATVGYQELASAPFGDKQQLVLAQGCQTYSQYADMMYASPAKSEDNLDVITTVNYSYGRGTDQLLASLLKVDRFRRHQPVDYYTLVGDLNADWTNRAYEVFYGVMGIDGNTRLHPYASVENIGADCRSATSCGDLAGNACLKIDGRKQCAALAIAADACPEGTAFKKVARQNTIIGGACVATR